MSKSSVYIPLNNYNPFTPVHFYKMDARPSLATKVYCYTYGNINIEIDKPEYLWVPKEKKYCTKMCSYYYHFGSCKKGVMCNFSHNYEPWMEVPPAPQKEPDANKNNKKAKSVPCKFFFEENCCLRGPECTFSHDPEVYSKFRSEHSKIEASKETNVY